MPRRLQVLGAVVTAVILAAGTGAAVHASTSDRSAPAPAQAACAAGTDVQTTTGPVCGIVVNGVEEWLGIPYAAPPVGALRWQPPQPAAPWSATVQATAFGSECTQPFSTLIVLPLHGSENCLFINVWRPPGAIPASGLPVMVHIHGGGFRSGSGNSDNTLLATTGDEVIVSMNYRLGIFGFLANSAFGPNSGDYGLQDQQAALRWVQNNIAAFGGNPHDLTIFGESAGGSSVCDEIDSPTAAGLFQKAISTSGEYNGLLGVPGPADTLEPQDCKAALPSQAQADSLGASFAAAVGCGPGTADVAACLQQVPAADVAQVGGFGYQYGGQGTIAPTINGTTLTMTLRQALKTGQVNRVPVIAGTDRDENLIGDATTASSYLQLVDSQYGTYAPQVLALYPLSHFESPFVAFRTVAADSDTVCPSIITDQALARRMPVYAYLITDNDIPPYAPTGTANTPAGASHVGAWFLNPVSPALDANQQALQNQEVADVTTFARTGDPSALNTPTWPEFNHSRAEMELAPAGDSQVMPISQIEANHNCGFWDRIAPRP
jgi:para-nitrobenzyl esterase